MSDAETPPEPTIRFTDVPAPVAARLRELGASDGAVNGPLYRALAHHQEALMGWIELSWRLRTSEVTPSSLRELMIVRGAQLADCDYERLHHEELAQKAGVTVEQLRALATWRDSDLFSDRERLALELAEGLAGRTITEDLLGRLQQTFTPVELVELMVTAALYVVMVPPLVEALRLPVSEHYLRLGAASPSYVPRAS